MITEQQAKDDTMELMILISNAMKKEKIDKAITKDYKAEKYSAVVVGDIIIHIMNMVTIAWPNGKFPDYLLTACGSIIMQMVRQSFAYKGLPMFETSKVSAYVFQKYLRQHPEIDKKWAGQELKKLQAQLANGSFVQNVAKATKTDPNKLQAQLRGGLLK